MITTESEFRLLGRVESPELLSPKGLPPNVDGWQESWLQTSQRSYPTVMTRNRAINWNAVLGLIITVGVSASFWLGFALFVSSLIR